MAASLGRDSGSRFEDSQLTIQAITALPTVKTEGFANVVVASDLAEDVHRGPSAPQGMLPSKYLCDDRGVELSDAICRTLEYSPTRAEAAPLDAIAATGRPCRYVPADISESAALSTLPPAPTELLAFLGSTIGNFDETEAVEFLKAVRNVMGPEDFFLLGTDLVKDRGVLIVSSRDQDVYVDAFDWTVPFCGCKSIRTETSRKHAEVDARELFGRAGMEVCEWLPSDHNYFALALAHRTLGDS